MSGCLTVIMLFLVAILALALFGNDDDKSGPNDFYITAAAQGHVDDYLKAPSSAKFDIASVHKQPQENTWAVLGYVDSQNSFGAMLRIPYAAMVKNVCADYLSKGCWSLESLVLDGKVIKKTEH